MSSLSSDMVRIYLQEIGKYPLLKPDEEIAYARLVQEMIAIEQSKNELTQQLEREPTMTELANTVEKTETQVRSALHLGQKAKQKMVTANLRLVVSVAKKYQNRNLEFLDLIQEGAIGLQRGIEKFDPNRGYRLSTYAYWWISQAITRAIAEQSRTIRLPVHLTDILNKIKKVQRESFQKLGRHATAEEIAKSLNLSTDKLREYLAASRTAISLNKQVGDEQETELGEILADVGVSPEKLLTQELLSQDVAKFLEPLTPIQRQVLTLSFGLDNDQHFNLAQIGQQLNLSRERIRQIQVKAISILRHRQNDIQEYLFE
ncbi:RpoD/SigA family RNA polymerase sigma factor (plasmid) [Nostoc sp. C052]|uniref:RpoD/SigA family RNA polymerase sigma factor n=1 Tax=Nostoc sp. C052 TaxID=2576902 RepID=UPI0015C3FE93|nr:RpoD/SigA family RNA polymerase sigma factor [Nostoc sp. C052]QLE45044.1 RpoD/SigA family RNA polymerase sigma factor [Nostoc sp. C052]QLE46035.1 RpoD/SigA family RNA polymerase sigma factor [Nostoc sp. C052]